MSNDIRLAISFRGHRKRRKLKMLLGPGATDYLLDLWIATAQNHPDGHLRKMDEIDIALEAGWEDDANKFVNALVDSGFIEKNGDGSYKLHDWEEHQPFVTTSKARIERAKKAASVRWGCKENANSMQDACKSESTSNAPTNQPTYQEIVGYLNKKTASNFKSKSKATQTCIKARWNEGYRLEDFKAVIDFKTKQWATDEKMVEYLRPSTLFSTKFESYLNAAQKIHPEDEPEEFELKYND